ncbi:MAG: ABC transporter substrate-binding protein [Alphaproteobacteria bacterium]|nr:ABC transporter substrate-binding protein [Alphaproteobacteria bacterium]
MQLPRLAALLIAALFLAVPALAADAPPGAHAIAMHGAPKYPDGFKHFDYVNPDAPKDGTLHMAQTGSFDSLNPFIVRGAAAAGIPYIYDTLMARSRDEPFTLYGLIAQRVDVPADRSSMTIYLDKRARWHDGVPMTAADVIFSWQTLRKFGRPNHRAYYARAKAEQLDRSTVRFTFTPDADGKIDRELPLIFGLMTVLPKHYWQSETFNATTLTPPVGSGPYRIAAVDPGRSITYERVTDYWAADLPANRGLYNFDKIVFDYYRDDAVALQAFKAGQADVRVETDPARWAEAYESSALASGKIKQELLKNERADVARAFAFNLRRPLFQDPVLREAIASTFDFNWVNRALFYGMAKRTASYFPNSALAATGTPGTNELKYLTQLQEGLPQRLFNLPVEAIVPPGDAENPGGPEAMRPVLREQSEKLRAAGYTLRFGELVTPKGVPVAFELLLGDPADEKIALAFARGLAPLGIKVTVRTADGAQYAARLTQFDYDMASVSWFNSLSPGNEQQVYWGSRAADQKGSRNYPGVKSEAVDRLIRAIPLTSSRTALIAAARALDRILLWGFYTVPLYYLGVDYVASWEGIAHPAEMPLYGFVLESWWREG